jgi:hypothetical protein
MTETDKWHVDIGQTIFVQKVSRRHRSRNHSFNREWSAATFPANARTNYDDFIPTPTDD